MAGSIAHEHLGIKLAQFTYHRLDIAPRALEQRNLCRTRIARDRQPIFPAGSLRLLQHLVNLGQGEPEAFALQDQAQAVEILEIVEPRVADPRRPKQAFALIKPQGPQRPRRISRANAPIVRKFPPGGPCGTSDAAFRAIMACPGGCRPSRTILVSCGFQQLRLFGP
jgi:hypothetical protein